MKRIKEDGTTFWLAIMIILFIIAGFFLSGCQVAEQDMNNNYGNTTTYGPFGVMDEMPLKVYTRCEDKVVCYDHDDSYGNSGSCFRDADLVEKYCGDEQ